MSDLTLGLGIGLFVGMLLGGGVSIFAMWRAFKEASK